MTLNLKLIKETFLVLVENNIDPNEFVNWYCLEGASIQENELLEESCKNWLKSQTILNESWKGAALGAALGGALGGPVGLAAGAYLGKKWNQIRQNAPKWAAKAVEGGKNVAAKYGAEKEYENIYDKRSSEDSQRFKKNAFLTQRAISNFLNRIDNSVSLREKVQNSKFQWLLFQLKDQLARMSFIENKITITERGPDQLLNESILLLDIEKKLNKCLTKLKGISLEHSKILEKSVKKCLFNYENNKILEASSFENERNIQSLRQLLSNLKALDQELIIANKSGVDIQSHFIKQLKNTINLVQLLTSDLETGATNFPSKPIKTKKTRKPIDPIVRRSLTPVVFNINPNPKFSDGEKIMINPLAFIFESQKEVILKNVDIWLKSKVETFDQGKIYKRGDKPYLAFEVSGSNLGLPISHFVQANSRIGNLLKTFLERIIDQEVKDAKEAEIKTFWKELQKKIETQIDSLVGTSSP